MAFITSSHFSKDPTEFEAKGPTTTMIKGTSYITPSMSNPNQVPYYGVNSLLYAVQLEKIDLDTITLGGSVANELDAEQVPPSLAISDGFIYYSDIGADLQQSSKVSDDDAGVAVARRVSTTALENRIQINGFSGDYEMDGRIFAAGCGLVAVGSLHYTSNYSELDDTSGSKVLDIYGSGLRRFPAGRQIDDTRDTDTYKTDSQYDGPLFRIYADDKKPMYGLDRENDEFSAGPDDYRITSAAIAGGRIIVGYAYSDTNRDMDDDDNQTGEVAEEGYVEIYNLQGQLIKTITANNQSNQKFGAVVASSGTHIAVGAPHYGSADQGAVYVYDMNGTLLYRKLGVPGSSDRFGTAVAISGNILAVGVPGEDVGGTNKGQLELFNVHDGNLLREYYGSATNDYLGRSATLAIDGDIVVLGDPGFDNPSAPGSNNGAVYILRVNHDKGAPVEIVEIGPIIEGTTDGQKIGSSVAIDNGIVTYSAWDGAAWEVFIIELRLGSGSLDDKYAQKSHLSYIEQYVPHIVPDRVQAMRSVVGAGGGGAGGGWPSGDTTGSGTPGGNTQITGMYQRYPAQFKHQISYLPNDPDNGEDWFTIDGVQHIDGGLQGQSGIGARAQVAQQPYFDLLPLHSASTPTTLIGEYVFEGKAFVYKDDGSFVYGANTSSEPYKLFRTLDDPKPGPVPDSQTNGSRFGSGIAVHRDNDAGSPNTDGKDVSFGVGATGEDLDGSNDGIGYVFGHNQESGASSNLQLEDTFRNPDPVSPSYTDAMGSVVVMNDDYVAYGAPLERTTDLDIVGKVYVFSRSTGLHVHTIENPGDDPSYDNDFTTNKDKFGERLALNDNNVLVIGVPEEDAVPNSQGGGSNAGKAFLYNVATGALITKIANPRTTGNLSHYRDRFGDAVAISDDFVVISAPGTRQAISDGLGYVYVFNTSGVLQYTINNPINQTGINFGKSVDIYDDGEDQWIAVGSPNAYTGVSPNVADSGGRVYVYKRDGSSQVTLLIHEIENQDWGNGIGSARDDDEYGRSVAIDKMGPNTSGDFGQSTSPLRLAAGAPGYVESLQNTGQVVVHELNPLTSARNIVQTISYPWSEVVNNTVVFNQRNANSNYFEQRFGIDLKFRSGYLIVSNTREVGFEERDEGHLMNPTNPWGAVVGYSGYGGGLTGYNSYGTTAVSSGTVGQAGTVGATSIASGYVNTLQPIGVMQGRGGRGGIPWHNATATDQQRGYPGGPGANASVVLFTKSPYHGRSSMGHVPTGSTYSVYQDDAIQTRENFMVTVLDPSRYLKWNEFYDADGDDNTYVDKKTDVVMTRLNPYCDY
jgi:hypothetical protein